MNALVYVDTDQGIQKGKSKVARNEKRKKPTWVFLYIKYSKAFRWNISLSANLLFLKSGNIELNLGHVHLIFTFIRKVKAMENSLTHVEVS